MRTRVCGREQEFGLVIIPEADEGDKLLIIRTIIDLISKTTVSMSFQKEVVWLGNGAKVYNDGGLLEWASAECRPESRELILQERFMEKTLNRIVGKLARIKKLKKFKIRIYKNTVGLKKRSEEAGVESDYSPEATAGHGNYYDYVGYVSRPENPPKPPPNFESLFSAETAHGSHHNYSYDFPRKKAILRLFRNFLPVSLFLSGSGHIIRTKNGKCVYGFSQRAPHVNCLRSMESPNSHRPLVSTKDREDSTAEGSFDGGAEELSFGRLHIVSRDATRCEFQTWLVDMVTHLVLRLAEEGWRLPKGMRLTNPLRTLHSFNVNLAPEYKVRACSGPTNVVDYNRVFLEAAQKLKGLSAEEAKGLREWRHVLNAFEAGKFHLLIGKLDWATKLILLAKARKKGCRLDNVYTWKLLMDYHDISCQPEQSGFTKLDQAGVIRHLVSGKKADRLMSRPPKTRARARGLFIKLGKGFRISQDDFSLDWDYADFWGKRVEFSGPRNPLRINISAVKRFYEDLIKEHAW